MGPGAGDVGATDARRYPRTVRSGPVPGPRQGGRATAVRRALGATAAVGLLLVTAACLPQDRGEAAEVDDGSAGASQVAAPPRFPDTGPVPPGLLVDALVYDFTSVTQDVNLWVPPTEQAQCAAEQIVATLGAARLSELGYRPATSGASLNDIDLTAAERDSVALLFEGCVDMTEAVATLLLGDGRLSTAASTCVAEGLAQQDQLGPFVEAWAFGREVDPFAEDGALANAVLQFAAVCISENAFTFYDVDLPGDDEVQGTGDSVGPTSTTLPGTPDGLSSRTGSADDQTGDGTG